MGLAQAVSVDRWTRQKQTVRRFSGEEHVNSDDDRRLPASVVPKARVGVGIAQPSSGLLDPATSHDSLAVVANDRLAGSHSMARFLEIDPHLRVRDWANLGSMRPTVVSDLRETRHRFTWRSNQPIHSIRDETAARKFVSLADNDSVVIRFYPNDEIGLAHRDA